jgi:NAD(P)-dependent dehydrogenase (short-subunit alcohol dehydrogenase family)
MSLALITGAGRGIGRAIALRLSGAGVPVVLVARSSEEITELRNLIVDRGGKAYATPCDVSISSEVNALRDDIVSELGTVNILVNNAGIAPSSKFEAITDDVWRETFAINVDGAFYMTRAFLPGMIAQSMSSPPAPSPSGERAGVRGFHVISNASTAALEGFRYTAAYTASKHALLGLMRALAEEYRKTDVKFGTICPGFTRTQILSEAIQASMARGSTREKAEAMFSTMNQEGRIIEPEEIAETVYKIINNQNLESGLVYDWNGTVLES